MLICAELSLLITLSFLAVFLHEIKSLRQNNMRIQDHKLLNALHECSRACYHCSVSCLREKDVKMMTECIRLDMDCAQICDVTAAFICRESRHAHHLLKECAEICHKCAEECGKHAHLEHCKECAEACRNCAALCETY